MKKTTFLVLLSFISLTVVAQEEPRPWTSSASFMVGLGTEQTNISLAYQYAWKLGKKQKLEMGVGARFSGFFANNKYFHTATESTAANRDSVYLPTSQINTINVLFNLGYSFSEKFRAGFNIDVIGFSFGGSQSGTYINGSTQLPVTASPSTFNLLLAGENDRGSLNSEFFVAYAINEKFSAKLGVQHVFMEYTTDVAVQQFPEANDRFRITPTVVCLGVAYKIH